MKTGNKKIVAAIMFASLIVLTLFLAVNRPLGYSWDTLCMKNTLTSAPVTLQRGEDVVLVFDRGYLDLLQPDHAFLQISSAPTLKDTEGLVVVYVNGQRAYEQDFDAAAKIRLFQQYMGSFSCGTNTIRITNLGMDSLTINSATVGMIPPKLSQCKGIYLQPYCTSMEAEGGCVKAGDANALSSYCLSMGSTSTTYPYSTTTVPVYPTSTSPYSSTTIPVYPTTTTDNGGIGVSSLWFLVAGTFVAALLIIYIFKVRK